MPAPFTQLRLVFLLPNLKLAKPALNISSVTVPTSAERTAIAQAAYDTVDSSGLMDLYPAALVFERAEVQNYVIVPPSEEDPEGSITPTSLTATSVGDAITGGEAATLAAPPQLCTVYTMYSETPGPRGRGRAYFPGPAESNVSAAGRITVDWANSLQTDITAVYASAIVAAPGDAVGVVVSRKYDALRTVISQEIHPVARTQRRRALRNA